jgi:hypothetical protein
MCTIFGSKQEKKTYTGNITHKLFTSFTSQFTGMAIRTKRIEPVDGYTRVRWDRNSRKNYAAQIGKNGSKKYRSKTRAWLWITLGLRDKAVREPVFEPPEGHSMHPCGNFDSREQRTANWMAHVRNVAGPSRKQANRRHETRVKRYKVCLTNLSHQPYFPSYHRQLLALSRNFLRSS